MLYPKSVHDHELQEYYTNVNLIKTKCKRIAQTSQHNLREIFNDITRSDPSGTQVTFKECESSMFRARRLLQPKIHASASEFCQQLPETSFALHLKATITLENRIAIIFFSDHIYEFVNNISSIQFDGTFQTVPKQFYQLWTVFLSFGNHSIPGIHCLLTNKDEELYLAVIHKIQELIPQLQPVSLMSDWEKAPRNAFMQVYQYFGRCYPYKYLCSLSST